MDYTMAWEQNSILKRKIESPFKKSTHTHTHDIEVLIDKGTIVAAGMEADWLHEKRNSAHSPKKKKERHSCWKPCTCNIALFFLLLSPHLYLPHSNPSTVPTGPLSHVILYTLSLCKLLSLCLSRALNRPAPHPSPLPSQYLSLSLSGEIVLLFVVLSESLVPPLSGEKRRESRSLLWPADRDYMGQPTPGSIWWDYNTHSSSLFSH